MKKFYVFILISVICYSAVSQQLTATFGGAPFKLDWQRAGFPGDTVPSYAIVKDIMAFGANNTGAASTNAAFTAAVASLAGRKWGNLFSTRKLFVYGHAISSKRFDTSGSRFR